MPVAAHYLPDIARTWRKLEARARVKLSAVSSERHYQAMVGLMNELLDRIGERESHPFAGLLEIVTMFVREYEERHVTLPDASATEVLRFLMEARDLRPLHLVELFGSRSTVHRVLNGTRGIRAAEARLLAKRFSVSPEVFL